MKYYATDRDDWFKQTNDDDTEPTWFGPGSRVHDDMETWVAAGNTIVPYIAPTVVITEVSAAQAKIALVNAGLYDEIEAYFNDSTTDKAQSIAWHNATTFSTDSPTLAAAAIKFGITSAQMSALFAAAAVIVP